MQLVRTDTWIGDVGDFGSPLVLPLDADPRGRVHLDSLPIGDWSVQVDWNGQSGLRRLHRGDSTVDLALRECVAITLRSQGDSSSVLRVAGSNWAWNSNQGSFRVALPPGEYALTASRGTSLAMAGHVEVAATSASDSAVSIDYRRIVIDDFATNDGKTTLWQYTSFGNWYTTASSGARIFSPTDSSRATFDGQLDMSYTLPDTNGYAIAGISFVNGRGYHDLDLSSMDSLCFEATGGGQLQPYLSHFNPDLTHSSATSPALPLTSQWTRSCLTPASFSTRWDSIKTTANDLAFLARKGSRVQVRNIVLWGVPFQTLAP